MSPAENSLILKKSAREISYYSHCFDTQSPQFSITVKHKSSIKKWNQRPKHLILSKSISKNNLFILEMSASYV